MSKPTFGNPAKIEKILSAIREGHEEHGAIVKATGITRGAVGNYLYKLCKAGVLKRERVTEQKPVTFFRYGVPK